MSLLFWSSIILFPRVYWFLCMKTFQTMYLVGKITPKLIKRLNIENKNALDTSQGKDDTPSSNGL